MQHTILNQQTIDATSAWVQQKMQHDFSGHDWWHVKRVWQNSIYIAQHEEVQSAGVVVELAALLHDIADWKFNDQDMEAGPALASQWLSAQQCPPLVIESVAHIIRNISFKGANTVSEALTLEGQIVQDADRLDAMGAMGIARVFLYGGNQQQAMYDPGIKLHLHNSFEEYKNRKTTCINHFYEKLLLLKDRMNTKIGRKLADQRHQYMVGYLKQFEYEQGCCVSTISNESKDKVS